MKEDFDGSYAEYCLIPTEQIYPVDTDMNWITLATIPEIYYTAYGSLFKSLNMHSQETMLIKGGIDSVGLAALEFSKKIDMVTILTTRKIEKVNFLKEKGTDHVLIEDEHLMKNLLDLFPEGVNKILDLIGTNTIKNSFKSL